MSLRNRILNARLKSSFNLRRRRSHYGVFLMPERIELQISPGERGRFAFFVENDSDHAVLLKAEVQGLAFGWMALLSRDDPSLRVEDAFTLDPGERAHYQLTLRPPRTLEAGQGEAILTVIDVNNPTMTATAVAALTVAGPRASEPGD